MAPKGTLLLMVMVLSASGMTMAWPPWKDHMSVNIINDVGGDPISVHCKSGDTDLGQHTVFMHQTFGFGFYPNFGGTTQFWCTFNWGSKWQSFTVWKDIGPFPGEKSRKRPCDQCVYMVRADAFWRSEGPGGPFTQIAQWK
ncbi:hypothetical protein M758_9G092400 [Ceratodon purpureus]|nr:hypothetical protein M758_9G092400 [Ceratodon purpureus]